jgi:LysM repeat protein
MYDDYIDEASAMEIDYTMELGESLEEVAKAFKTSVEEIAEINPNLTTEQYVPGRRIRVPYRRPARRAAYCPGGYFYTVRPRDDFYRIAARYGISLAALLRANPGIDPGRLYIGQSICIPEIPRRMYRPRPY